MRILVVLLLLILPASAIAGEGDIALYEDIAAEVSGGASYYESAAALHRERSFPLHPFYTVRPPAQAYLVAAIGPTGLLLAAWALMFLSLAAWFKTLKDHAFWERAGFMGLLSLSGGAVISQTGVFAHELLAGLLVTLALGLSWDRRLQLVVATSAVLLRELAVPFLILLLYPFERKQTIRVGCAIALIAVYYVWHFAMVSSVVLPDDLRSPGWFGMRGPVGLSDHFSTLTSLNVPIWIVFTPLFGWFFYREPLPFLWCSGVVLAVCVIAREDNLFWLLMLMPIYWAGLVFLVRPFVGLASRLLQARSRPFE